MEDLRSQIRGLFAEGRIEHLSSGELSSLDKEAAERKLREAQKVSPGTYKLAGTEIRKRIESEIRSGRLPFVSVDDVVFLTQDKAENLAWLADIAGRRPVREAQLERLRSFMARGYAERKDDKELEGLTDSEAQKLLEAAEARFHSRVVIDARTGKEVRLG